MNRKTQMELCIHEYRISRRKEKSMYVMRHYNEMIHSFNRIVDKLIQQQLHLQKSGEMDEIKALCFLRLLSSEYTGSYEMAVGMCSKRVHLDEHMAHVYWKPEAVYEGIDTEIEALGRFLRKWFSHIEEYEILCLKQELLADDWLVFGKIIRVLAKVAEQRIMNSSILKGKEIQVLFGDYTGQLKNVCLIGADNTI